MPVLKVNYFGRLLTFLCINVNNPTHASIKNEISKVFHITSHPPNYSLNIPLSVH